MKLPRDLQGEDLAKHLRIGTLNAILSDVAAHKNVEKEDTLKGL